MAEEGFLRTFNKRFEIVDSGTVTLSKPQCNDEDTISASVVASHTLGFIPSVIAFANIPSTQSPGSDYIYFFGGGSHISTGSISAGSISVNYARIEEVIATATQITFSLQEVNATGFAQPAVDIPIKWFAIREVAPS